jgi:hypothetical protein
MQAQLIKFWSQFEESVSAKKFSVKFFYYRIWDKIESKNYSKKFVPTILNPILEFSTNKRP